MRKENGYMSEKKKNKKKIGAQCTASEWYGGYYNMRYLTKFPIHKINGKYYPRVSYKLMSRYRPREHHYFQAILAENVEVR
jgi:hypothetical protein